MLETPAGQSPLQLRVRLFHPFNGRRVPSPTRRLLEGWESRPLVHVSATTTSLHAARRAAPKKPKEKGTLSDALRPPSANVLRRMLRPRSAENNQPVALLVFRQTKPVDRVLDNLLPIFRQVTYLAAILATGNHASSVVNHNRVGLPHFHFHASFLPWLGRYQLSCCL